MDLWPLLTDDLLNGVYSIERHLRPKVTAVAVRSDSLPDAQRVITELCTRWGGGFSPLVAVDETATDLGDRVAAALLGSNIDGLEGRKLLPDTVEKQYSDRSANASQWLLRQLIYLPDRPTVQTCRGVPPEDPWYGSYLAAFGDLPDQPNPDRNRRNELKSDLSFSDLVDVRSVEATPSLADILARLRNPKLVSAVNLTRFRLPTSIVAGYNLGFPSNSRFRWGQSSASTQYGPNLTVIYQPGSVEDLALIWNLRARFGHPYKLPLAIPLTENTAKVLQELDQTTEAQHWFGFGHNMAVTSCSTDTAELRALVVGTDFDVVDPWDVFGEIRGGCVASTEMAQFVDGIATVSSFSPTDIETLGQAYLGSSHATWLTLTAVVSRHRLPRSKTMRRTRWHEPGYLHGKIVHVGELDKFATLLQPSGLEVLRALALDRSLQARISTPGKAGENLIRASDADLSMFAYPGVAVLMEKLTRRGHSSLVKRRLDQFLAGSDVVPSTEKYETLASRLDAALGTPESDETGDMNFNGIKQTLGLTVKQTAAWIDWAVRRRLLLRGVRARCENCKHVQWRTLADTIPELQCHGCGLVIDTPFGAQKIDYQYRASEVLLRALEYDVLPAILAIRHICQVLRGSDGAVFGAYPGIEIVGPDSSTVSAELDVVVVLGSGEWLVGECKARARGLNEIELQKLWAAADRVGAPATFTATLDPGSACSEVWRRTTDPNGRPHFALTAGHLYDLAGYGPLGGQELFEWREELVRLPPDSDLSDEGFMGKAFGDYLLRRNDDSAKRPRAPWDSDEE